MSRILSVITVICLVLTCVGQAEVSPDEAFFFIVENGEATVVGVDADLVGPDIAVPAVLLGFPVTAIGGGAFEGEIKSIKLPASIERIGEAAFPAGAGLVVHAGSPAAEYAEANGLSYTYAEQSPDTPGSAEEIQAELNTCAAEADAIRMEIVGVQEDIWVQSSGDSSTIAELNEQLATLEDELAAVEERRERLEAELMAVSASTGPAAWVKPTVTPSESSVLDVGEAAAERTRGIAESALASVIKILDGAQHRFDGVVQVSGSDASQSSNCAVSIDQLGLDEEGGLQILGGCNILREDGTYQEEEILVQINESGIFLSTPWLEYAQSAAPEGIGAVGGAVLATFREDGEAWSTLWGSLWEEMNAREGWLEEMDTAYSVDMAAFQRAIADVLSDMATEIPFLRILEGMRLMDAMSIPESQRRVAAMMLLKTLSSYVSEMEIPEDTTLSYRQEANGLSLSVAVGAATPILAVECADDRLTVEIVPTGGWNVHFSRERGEDGWTDEFSARDASGETEIIVEGSCTPGDEGSIYAYEAIACLNGMLYDIRASWTANSIETAPAGRAERSSVPAQAPETAQEADAATGATPVQTTPGTDAVTGATPIQTTPGTDAVTGATPAETATETDVVATATPETASDRGTKENPIPVGEVFSFTQQLLPDGTPRTDGSDAGYLELPISVVLAQHLTPEYYEEKYSQRYGIRGDEAGVRLHVALGDCDGLSAVSLQNAIDFAFERESGEIEEGGQLRNAEISGDTFSIIDTSATGTVYKRYVYGAESAVPYLTLTYHRDGEPVKVYFSIAEAADLSPHGEKEIKMVGATADGDGAHVIDVRGAIAYWPNWAGTKPYTLRLLNSAGEIVYLWPSVAEVWHLIDQAYLAPGEVYTLEASEDSGSGARATTRLKLPASLLDKGEPIVFQDKGVEALVLLALKRGEGPVYEGELRAIKRLPSYDDLCDSKSPTGILDIKIWENAAPSNFYDDHPEIVIKSVADLANCESLESLYICYQPSLADISPLSGLERLSVLNLYDCGIRGLSPLANMSGLTKLELSSNGISDVSPLAGLPKLVHLYLAENSIKDVAPISEIKSLASLDVSDNGISDISALMNLENLRNLRIKHNPIGDIRPLSSLVNLEILSLGSIALCDIAPLSSLVNLRQLNITYSVVSDISPLANLTRLKWLAVSQIEFSSLSPLAGLVELEELYLPSCGIEDITPLGNMTELENLFLPNNDISDIGVLENLMKLRYLNLEENSIVDTSPLWALSQGDCTIYLEGNPTETVLPPETGGRLEEPVISVQGASLENGVYFMTKDNLAIAWSSGDDVIGYDVYLFDDDGTIQRSATSVQDEMIHITRRILPEDGVYEFRVVAHGENGEETSSSVYLSR